MNDYGTYIAGDSLRFERLLSAPPERVWEFLTKSEYLVGWLGDGEIDAKVGGEVFLRSGGPVIRGTVLVSEPPSRLSYTWNVLMLGEETPMTIESTLHYEMTEEDGKTRLVLTQGPIESDYRGRAGAGWHAILDILGAHAAGEDAPDFMDVFQRVYPDYEMRAAQP
ncbi:MAG: hypothetical protein RJB62_1493 [Pseudomonadota bacterium]|jgi:uncharacterized protein YndB with AHSA1/START domain